MLYANNEWKLGAWRTNTRLSVMASSSSSAADAARSDARKRRRVAPMTQVAVVPGRRVGTYQEPDHAAGEAAWPGKQPATKQLSLFETTTTFAKVKDDASQERLVDLMPSPEQTRERLVDLMPSPEQTRVVQTTLTTFSGFGSLSTSSASGSTDDASSSDDGSRPWDVCDGKRC